MKTKLSGFIVLLTLFVVQFSYAQEKEVTGTVQDEEGIPLAGVNVSIMDAEGGTSTDGEGNYELKVEEGQVLRFSFVGFETQTKTVGEENVINVILKEGTELDEIVVTGYGTQRKSDVTGSISQIKSEQIQGEISPSFESILAGKASGVEITSPSVIGEAPNVNIRGIASINSGTQPLYIVDGMPYQSAQGGGNMDVNPLSDLSPNDIESIEILNNGAASAIYGSRAANGVILITTKSGTKESFNVNLSTRTGFGQPMKTYDLLNTGDFITISNEKAANAGEDDWASGTDYNIDWQDVVLRDYSLQTNNNVSVSGGTKKRIYYLSFCYANQEGASINNKSQNYNIRAKVDQEISSWLELGASLNITRSQINAMNKGSNALSGHMFNALQQPPNIPIYNEDNESGYNITSTGTIGQWDNNKAVGAQLPNIMMVLDKNYYKSNRRRNV